MAGTKFTGLLSLITIYYFSLKVYVGASDRCSWACIAAYIPVCSFDGEKYQVHGNECQLGWAQCKAKEKGEKVPVLVDKSKCPSIPPEEEVTQKERCNSRCSDENRPVCAFAYNESNQSKRPKYFSYTNQCLLEIDKCMARNNGFTEPQQVPNSYCGGGGLNEEDNEYHEDRCDNNCQGQCNGLGRKPEACAACCRGFGFPKGGKCYGKISGGCLCFK